MVLSYKSVKQTAEAEIIEKKSRFIATIAPVSTEEEALSFVDNIKKTYKDANHNCFAYRVGLYTLNERRSDDGEPSGTAGVPMLDVLKKEGLINVAAVVTRYFGGILLGGGGLVRAYSSSCAAGLRSAGIVEKRLMQDITVSIDYTLAGKIQYELNGRDIILYNTVYGKDVTFYMRVPFSEIDSAVKLFTQLSSGRLKLNKLGTEYS